MDKRVDRSVYEDELKSREIVKVTEGELFEAAQKFGSEISEESQKTLAGNLQKAIQKEGIAGALKYCNLEAYPLTDSLQEHFKVRIRRASLKTRNPSNAPDSLEQSILKAYQYNSQNDLPLEDNVQAAGEEMLLYSKPIVINNPLCLQCHGKVGEELTTQTNDLIKNLYPSDNAIGYKIGDFRGMWSIKIPKKELIKHSFQ